MLFKLPISATDITSIYDTEDRIRQNFGLPLSKGLAEELGLPIKTEWVITRQDYIRHYKKYEGEMKKDNKLSTKIFKEYSKSMKFKDYIKNVKKVKDEIGGEEFNKWLYNEQEFPFALELRKYKDGSFEVCLKEEATIQPDGMINSEGKAKKTPKKTPVKVRGDDTSSTSTGTTQITPKKPKGEKQTPSKVDETPITSTEMPTSNPTKPKEGKKSPASMTKTPKGKKHEAED